MQEEIRINCIESESFMRAESSKSIAAEINLPYSPILRREPDRVASSMVRMNTIHQSNIEAQTLPSLLVQEEVASGKNDVIIAESNSSNSSPILICNNHKPLKQSSIQSQVVHFHFPYLSNRGIFVLESRYSSEPSDCLLCLCRNQSETNWMV